MLKGVGSLFSVRIHRLFDDSKFPCRKTDLLEHARQRNADEEMLECLQDLPDIEYRNSNQVLEGATQGT